ncbi:hypothetical protein ASG73_07785 [Janibacter sp. Soil728]|uniref:DUF3817 domain-containing protein n=1 Tax=Janibacter sp. Soil728 TaxID=1736393 RepID=UPI0006FC3B70|nr:DUF3817 domain-containing protein [Janibacter sp. Soil728]KRE37557.1 hypothetical protein ASG73_07785 [Janibacter sp. Soil728]
MSNETTGATTADPRAIATALRVFRVTAILAGLAMFVLILEMVLKYGMDNEALTWWSPVHGLIFMAFAVATANLGFKIGWPVGRMILTILLACVPFVAFVEERRVVREVSPLTT